MTAHDIRRHACIFPGQGSQSVGMINDMLATYEEVEHTFAEASGILGTDLQKLVVDGPDEELNETTNTQPVMLTASVALWRVWRRYSETTPPAQMCGHSVGEYAALVCAGSLAFEDALPLVHRRAKLMRQAVADKETAMVAVLGTDNDTLKQACDDVSAADTVAEPVNYNAEGQTVVAGHKKAIENLIAHLTQSATAKCIVLPVSVPAHSSLMKDAASEYAEVLADVRFKKPRIPVIRNTDAHPHGDETEIRMALTKQIDHPVLWADSVRSLVANGITSCLEVGPGKVLCGLNRRIDKKIKNYPLNTPKGLETAKQDLAG